MTFQTSPLVGVPESVSVVRPVKAPFVPVSAPWVPSPLIEATKAGPVTVTVEPLTVALKRPVASPLTASAMPFGDVACREAEEVAGVAA